TKGEKEGERMYLYRNDTVSIKEYFQIRERSDELLEYIDGLVYMSPSPSTKHQRVSNRLVMTFNQHLRKDCEEFPASYDIELKDDKTYDTKIVIPDISIICDKSGFTEERYVGVPDLIVEILSPSNQSHDLVTKLNLYMAYRVKEYWIVNPMLDTITVYTLNNENMYEQHDIKTDRGTITSKFLDGLRVDLNTLFMEV